MLPARQKQAASNYVQKREAMNAIQLIVPGPMGGAEKVLLSGVSALRQAGSSTEIWVIQEQRVPESAEVFLAEAEERRIPTRTFVCRSAFDPLLKRVLDKELSAAKPAIVHAHGFKAVLYAYLCTPKFAKRLITHHGRTSTNIKVRIYEAIEKWLMKRADKVIAVSNIMRSDLERRGVARDKIEVVENLLSIQATPRELPTNEVLNLVCVGRVAPEKGIHILIEALSNLPPSIPFHLSLVGDGGSRASLEKLAVNLGIEESIEFLGFRKDVRESLVRADALAIPSLREGLPMTLIEACCTGLPVIGANVGGIPLIVKNGVNGLLFRSEDALDLAEKLRTFHADKRQYLERALEMSDGFLNRFSPAKWASTTMNVYEKCL